MIKTRDLSYTHTDRKLLCAINLRAAPGDLIKIIGANGSGKTTLLRILSSLLPPDRGEIHWNNKPLTEDPDSFREDTLYIGHQTALSDHLTPLENLHSRALLRRRPPICPLPQALTDSGIPPSLHHRPSKTLSAGQKRRVALASLRAFPATLWLLDEPTAALDPDGKQQLTDHTRRHLQNGGITLTGLHQETDLPLPATRHLHLAA